jgi:AcrR family transcriptional regulator
MQEICAEAAMSPGALYRYFPSKDSIIEAIAVEEREHNGRFLRVLTTNDVGLETFLDTCYAWLEHAGCSGFAPLCGEVLAEARRNPRIREIFERNREEARTALLAALTRIRDKGEIDPALDLEVTLTTLMALGDGLMVRMPFEPEMTPDRIEPALRELIRRMLRPATR